MYLYIAISHLTNERFVTEGPLSSCVLGEPYQRKGGIDTEDCNLVIMNQLAGYNRALGGCALLITFKGLSCPYKGFLSAPQIQANN